MLRKLLRSRSSNTTPRRSYRPLLEPLEQRCVPAVVTWTHTDNGDFADGSKWTVNGSSPAVHRVPSPSDDAVIPAEFVVTSSVNQTVNSIRGSGLRILGGTFTVNNVNQDSILSNLVVGTGTTFRTRGQRTSVIGSEIAGTMDVESNALFHFLRDVNELNPGALLTGPGQYLMDGDVFGGPTVVLNTDITAPARFVLTWGIVEGAGKLTIPTGVTFDMTSTHNITTLRGTGITEIQSGATLLLAGGSDKTILNRTFNNAGTIRYVDGGKLTIGGNAVLNNLSSGLIRVETDLDLLNSETPVINNAGTFVKSSPTGTGNSRIYLPLHNTGTVRIESGSLSLWRSSTNTGTFDLAGGDLIVDAFGVGPAIITLNAGATFTGAGTVRLTVPSNSIFANANVSFSRFELSSGAFLDGPGTITFTGAATWSGGTMQGTGTTVVASGASLSVVDGSGKALTGSRLLRNQGTITHTGMNPISLGDAASLDNLAGATFRINSNAGFVGPTRLITNAGTFIFNSPTGTGVLALPHTFNNTGTLRIDAGTLHLNAFGRSSGHFHLAGSDLQLGHGSIGEYVLDAGATVTGTGTLRMVSGFFTVNAAVTVARYSQSGGTLRGPGTLTIS